MIDRVERSPLARKLMIGINQMNSSKMRHEALTYYSNITNIIVKCVSEDLYFTDLPQSKIDKINELIHDIVDKIAFDALRGVVEGEEDEEDSL